jgi:Zn-dependent protease with chaperone function
MKLRQDHWLVRYGFGFSAHGIPDRTNLCRLFWGVVLTTVGLLVIMVAFVAIMWNYALLWWVNPGVMLAVHAITVGALLTGWFYPDWQRRRRQRRLRRPKLEAPPSVYRETLWAVKNRVCPVIEIEPVIRDD